MPPIVDFDISARSPLYFHRLLLPDDSAEPYRHFAAAASASPIECLAPRYGVDGPFAASDGRFMGRVLRNSAGASSLRADIASHHLPTYRI